MRHVSKSKGCCGSCYTAVYTLLACLFLFSSARGQVNNKLFYGYITVYGTCYADEFVGDGGSLTNLQSINVTGTLAPSQLPYNLLYNYATNATLGSVIFSGGTVTGNLVGNVNSSGTSVFNNVGATNAVIGNLIVTTSVTLPNISGGVIPASGVELLAVDLNTAKGYAANAGDGNMILCNVISGYNIFFVLMATNLAYHTVQMVTNGGFYTR